MSPHLPRPVGAALGGGGAPWACRPSMTFVVVAALVTLVFGLVALRPGVGERHDSDAAATIATLERRLASLEAAHAKARLDLAAQVQSTTVDRLLTMVGGGGGSQLYPPVVKLPAHLRRRILVTGGAGFVGSHLVDALMMQGHNVYVLDNLHTGRTSNIQHWMGHPNFQFFQHDVTEAFSLVVDQIYHLACPASPPHYMEDPVFTLKTSVQGTLNMLALAKKAGARLLFTSTSEVYGDPLKHPQDESYWGNVNPIGPRACYDEGKRVAETMCYAYHQREGVQVRVARIFNTFGPRMHPNDGRVVSNFIIQALQGKPLTIYGDGSQTRSFQYVSDLVVGLIKLMNSEYVRPVNIGNPDEYTMNDFALKIQRLVGGSSSVQHLPATTDDPQKRRPDITTAKQKLGYAPAVSVEEGLTYTVAYFRDELGLGEGGGDVAAGGYTRRDKAPLWTTKLVNSALNDEEKGWAEPEGSSVIPGRRE